MRTWYIDSRCCAELWKLDNTAGGVLVWSAKTVTKGCPLTCFLVLVISRRRQLTHGIDTNSTLQCFVSPDSGPSDGRQKL